MKKKGIIVVTYDDINAYFLVIDTEERKVLKSVDTEDFGTWRYDDKYDEDALLKQIAEECGLTDYKVIDW